MPFQWTLPPGGGVLLSSYSWTEQIQFNESLWFQVKSLVSSNNLQEFSPGPSQWSNNFNGSLMKSNPPWGEKGGVCVLLSSFFRTEQVQCNEFWFSCFQKTTQKGSVQCRVTDPSSLLNSLLLHSNLMITNEKIGRLPNHGFFNQDHIIAAGARITSLLLET